MEILSLDEVDYNLKSLGGWAYTNNAIAKTFIFKNHSLAFGFMSRVALLAEKNNHHPYWSGVDNKINIKLSTHEVNGVTKNDIDFAIEIETFAND